MKTSLVVPCYNCAPTIGRALSAALAQTARIAIVCVDDGSTDETPRVLADLSAGHSNLTVIRQPNTGAPAARNRGLAEASDPYVQFLDADDEIGPDKVARQVALLETTGADFVAGSYRRLFVDGRATERIAQEEDPWRALAWTRLGITSANLFRTEAVDAVGGWTEGLKSHQEYDLMFRMLRNGARVVFDPVPDTVVYQQPTSISTAHTSNDVRMLDLIADVRKHLVVMGASPTDLAAVDDALFGVVRGLHSRSAETGRAARHRYLPTHFRPRPSAATSTLYALLYRLLGFEGAQRVSAWLKRVRS